VTASDVPARGQRLPRPARRKQLLGAAQEIFVAQGYHAAAMDDIAERAGVSKPVLYQHFPGKLELYMALLDEHATSLVKRVRTALGSTTDNRARVAASVAAYFDFVAGNGEGFRLVFESDLRNDPAVRERVERMTAECIAAITETIAHDTGFRAEEAQLLSVGLTGMAEIGARWWLASEDRLAKERAVELLVGLAWRGISGAPLHPDGALDGAYGSADG
jgi:AcrR family transcriptional regulator